MQEKSLRKIELIIIIDVNIVLLCYLQDSPNQILLLLLNKVINKVPIQPN